MPEIRVTAKGIAVVKIIEEAEARGETLDIDEAEEIYNARHRTADDDTRR